MVLLLCMLQLLEDTKYLIDEKKVDSTAVDYNGLTPVLCATFN
jgi:hypothetical protein